MRLKSSLWMNEWNGMWVSWLMELICWINEINQWTAVEWNEWMRPLPSTNSNQTNFTFRLFDGIGLNWREWVCFSLFFPSFLASEQPQPQKREGREMKRKSAARAEQPPIHTPLNPTNNANPPQISWVDWLFVGFVPSGEIKKYYNFILCWVLVPFHFNSISNQIQWRWIEFDGIEWIPFQDYLNYYWILKK